MYLVMYGFQEDNIFFETKDGAQAYYLGLLSKGCKRHEIAIYKIANVDDQGKIED